MNLRKFWNPENKKSGDESDFPLFPDVCVIFELLKIKTTIANEPVFFLLITTSDLLNTYTLYSMIF